jgi:hypothetical protein
MLGCGRPAGETFRGRGYLRVMAAINQVADPGSVGYTEAPKTGHLHDSYLLVAEW